MKRGTFLYWLMIDDEHEDVTVGQLITRAFYYILAFVLAFILTHALIITGQYAYIGLTTGSWFIMKNDVFKIMLGVTAVVDFLVYWLLKTIVLVVKFMSSIFTKKVEFK